MIRTPLIAIVMALAVAPPVLAQTPRAPTPPAKAMTIAQAVADPARPAEDKARDADRKPAEMLKFAGVKPGMTVVDLLPGGGYFTRLFADVVGPKGRVIGYVPDEMLKSDKAKARLEGLSTIGANVTPMHNPLLSATESNVANVVWTAQNYHDLHNIPGVDVVAFNKLVYATLKPGGVYVILDHAAKPGSGLSNTNDLHRIDPEVVKKEVTAAGFTFDGESKVLANSADDHTLNVFDKGLRGHTDQFIYRFKKPAK